MESNNSITSTDLPNNIDAEKRVLGVMMIDEDRLFEALEKLDPIDFYDVSHSIIFSALKEISKENRGVDSLVVSDYLNSQGKLVMVGGELYLDSLQKLAMLETQFESYVEIIFQKSLLRKLIKSSTNIISKANQGGDAHELLEFAETEIFNIAINRKKTDFFVLNDIIEKIIEDLKTREKTLDGLTGVPTGFDDLNLKLSGFQKSDLVILAARPSMGKTALGLNFAMNAATNKTNPVPVAIFSLEMSKEQLAMRMLAAASVVELNSIKTGDLSEKDFDGIRLGIQKYKDSKIFISECPAASVMEIRSQCRKLKAKQGLGMIVIDYLQLMSGDGESQQIMVSNISKGLKALAIEMSCPVIALSQLSRKPEERKNHRPILSDLRDSGSIEQDADIVMFLFREEYYEKDRDDLKNLAELIIAKNRNGEIGTVNLNWLPEWQLFEKRGGEEYYPEPDYYSEDYDYNPAF